MSGSPPTRSVGTELACGRCTRRRPSSVKRLERMKNTTSSSTTSMSETTLISGSSGGRPGLRFTARVPWRAGSGCRRRAALARPRRLERVGHADRLLLHLHDDALDPAAQVAVENERRDGDAQTRDRTDERLGDAAREGAGITHAAGL